MYYTIGRCAVPGLHSGYRNGKRDVTILVRVTTKEKKQWESFLAEYNKKSRYYPARLSNLVRAAVSHFIESPPEEIDGYQGELARR
jgi:hypothetical protein